ncbi:uncharacterized protein LOC131144267 [Malania oleifera]|uniref:uncharacterized protein LOC131144267 n=1 Tax=Malania oleifera TaxID=397392 RepID=UPI0025AE31BF|nr:uncharacterized protein LOC131144267 [Malania oleifera]
MASGDADAKENQPPCSSVSGPRHRTDSLVSTETAIVAEHSTSSFSGCSLLTANSSGHTGSCSSKRKRPPKIQIPLVLQEIQTDKLKFFGDWATQEGDPFRCFGEHGVGVSSVKGKKKFMEDAYKIASCSSGKSKKDFFGVYDGHGGKKAADFVAEKLHANIFEMLENCKGNEVKAEAIEAGYLKTDQEFLKQGVASGACCVTALIEEKEIAISNLGDCRAVLCRSGVAEALTNDHRAEREDERLRIENKGGYVEVHRGTWRVHGVLSVSRSIGDAHLKDWVLAMPETKVLNLTPDMEFLILASDGLWEEVGNQEAVDIVTRLCLVEKKIEPMGDLQKENDDEYACISTSPSSKQRRVSLVKKKKSSQSSSYSKIIDSWKEIGDDFASENESPPSKAQKISLVKRKNLKTQYVSQENNGCKKKPASAGLVAACKELVNLAVSRGSFDDVTVIIIDLNHFRCIPACFSSREKPANDTTAVARSGQSIYMSVYLTKIAGQCRLITITWCKNLLLHDLSVSVQAPDEGYQCHCKVELKPWYFWRKQGSRRIMVDGRVVDVVWDLKSAKFNGETEPRSDYYVAIVCEEEVVLLMGDLKKDAYRRTGCRPALLEPILVSRREHVFGKKKFSTRVKLHEKGRFHVISIEYNNMISIRNSSSLGGFDPEMEIKVDGHLAIHVKHLQWKFRGNESIHMNKTRVEVFWDVHDWLFSSGPRHALFIFKPIPSSTTPPSLASSPPLSSTPEANSNSTSWEEYNAGDSPTFCLFFHAWKVE